jgi:3-phytase
MLAGCAGSNDRQASETAAPAPVTVPEAWLSVRDETENVDSLAVWTDGDRQWLLATAKEADTLVIYDAISGQRLRAVGETGEGPGQFRRPNGISVVDNHVWVVERDNRRVQVLSLPDFEPVALFGSDVLEKPYGLWIDARDGEYRLFVTDAYEAPGERVPPPEELDRRLHRFDLGSMAEDLPLRAHSLHGPTEGTGLLKKVESLYGDPAHDRLLVAEEHASGRNVKVFDLDGDYTGPAMGDEVIRYEPEGIALHACDDGSGYWLVTDQDERDNRFLVFHRQSLRLAGAFTGETVSNTDGVWLHDQPIGQYDRGLFYAVHNDGSVAAFDWGAVMDALSLEGCGS